MKSFSLPGSPVSATWGQHSTALPRRASPLLLCRHSKFLLDEAGSGLSEDIWLLQPEGDRHMADPCRRAVCRLLELKPEWTNGKTVLEVDTGAGLVGLCATRLAKSVTITTLNDLAMRLVNLNLTMLSGSATSSSKLRWSGTTKRQTFSTLGIRGPVPVYMYTLPVTQRGAKEFCRQWQWDSGTAMRGLKAHLLKPSFDVIVAAAVGASSSGGCGSPENYAESLLQLADELLSHDPSACFLIAAPQHRPEYLQAVARRAHTLSFLVHHEEEFQEPFSEAVAVQIVRLCRTPPPWFRNGRHSNTAGESFQCGS